MHGSASKKAKEAGKRRVQQVRAEQAVAAYGLPREIDPAAALLEEVHRTAGHVAWLAAKVAEQQEDDLVWGLVEEADKTATETPGRDILHAARPSVWLDLYQRERKHLVQVSKTALDAGINERLVHLAEQQGNMLAEVIRRSADGLLAELAALLDEETAGRVRRAWPGWLARIVPAEIAAVSGEPR